jgi:hypothetical protein
MLRGAATLSVAKRLFLCPENATMRYARKGKKIAVWVPPFMHEAVKRLATQEECTISGYIKNLILREITKEELLKESKKYAIHLCSALITLHAFAIHAL